MIEDWVTYSKVAVEPFVDASAKTELVFDSELTRSMDRQLEKLGAKPERYGVAKISNTKTELVKLKLVANAVFPVATNLVRLQAGAEVLVRASDYAAPWGKEVFEYGGKKFILIPSDRIEMVL
jgi:hypothetical protein